MARITVEDCLEKIDNQYDLVLLAKERTSQLNAGAPMLVEEDNDKRTIISLREIGDGKISVKDDKYVLFIEGQKIINDSKTVWTYLEELNEVTISDFDPTEQDISINNVFEVYKEGYKHKFIGKEDGKNIVEIYPEDEYKSYFKISFKILENNQLSSFTVHDKSNSIFIYSIDDFLEEELDNSLFTFSIDSYPDIEVIDFR